MPTHDSKYSTVQHQSRFPPPPPSLAWGCLSPDSETFSLEGETPNVSLRSGPEMSVQPLLWLVFTESGASSAYFQLQGKGPHNQVMSVWGWAEVNHAATLPPHGFSSGTALGRPTILQVGSTRKYCVCICHTWYISALGHKQQPAITVCHTGSPIPRSLKKLLACTMPVDDVATTPGLRVRDPSSCL